MKILVISSYVPGTRAASMRLYQLLRNIGNHDITLLVLLENHEKLKIEVEKFWDKLIVQRFSGQTRNRLLFKSLFSSLPYPAQLYDTPKISKPVYQLLKKELFDVVLVMSPYLAACLNLNKIKKHCKVLGIDVNESNTVLWQTYAQKGTIAERIFAKLQLLKTAHMERCIFRTANCSFFVSEEERKLAQRNKIPDNKLWLVPNGVDPKVFKPQKRQPEKNTLLFLGALNVKRNASAIIWFAEQVFPLVRKAISDVKLNIVGARADSRVKNLGKLPAVNFIGEVKDICKSYAGNAIVISPHKLGGGTRLKVLESLSMQVPIVTTYAGIRGINIKGIQSIFLANNEKSFASQIIHVLRNYNSIKAKACNGRERVKKQYAWANISQCLGKELEELFELKRTE